MFHELDPAKIVATGERLCARIRERFPDANLGRVAEQLVAIARTTAVRAAAIRRPNRALRIISLVAVLAGALLVALAVVAADPVVADRWTLGELLQTIESGIASLLFVGAAFAFVWTLDVRRKRQQCLHAVHEMRAMAHIVDMHQLTKDPDRLNSGVADTNSSPSRITDRAQLARYLDYCSEMLSLIGKVAALYVQGFPDPVVLSAVDDVEDLTTSLSRKIWQKIMILDQARGSP